MSVYENVVARVKKTRESANCLLRLSTEEKNNILQQIADALCAQSASIIEANHKDMKAGTEKGLSSAMLDRLLLDKERVQDMARAVEEVIRLPDPVGKTTAGYLRPNGLQVCQMRIPIGVILMIYESRPNVTIEASALCFKSSNAIILRGGSEAFYSNMAIGDCIRTVLRANDLPEDLIQVLETTDREALNQLLLMNDAIDLVIPRGGPSLIEYVTQTSAIPVIQHFKGVCHLYVDDSAGLDQALSLLLNGKVQRPGVCNALETCLVDERIAESFFALAAPALKAEGVEIRGCEKTCSLIQEAVPASEDDYHAEFLDKIIAIRCVTGIDEAIAHITHYGSNHTEVICTESLTRAKQFVNQITSSVVMVNASSRFSDGGQLGLGAEIGISTSKLHAYGPMGLESLTTKKFVVTGSGQVR